MNLKGLGGKAKQPRFSPASRLRVGRFGLLDFVHSSKLIDSKQATGECQERPVSLSSYSLLQHSTCNAWGGCGDAGGLIFDDRRRATGMARDRAHIIIHELWCNFAS